MKLCAMAIIGSVAVSFAAAAESRELFADTAFARGFTLTGASHPGPQAELGVWRPQGVPEGQPPAWRLAQWGTKSLLEPGMFSESPEGLWAAENPAKRVTSLYEAGEKKVHLEVLGSVEYAGHARVAGEAWPHLLAEQRFETPLRLETLNQLNFKITMRVPYCRAAPGMEKTIEPGLHTAQVSAFWTVHNLSEGNPDYRDMIWFGIPFFDARYEAPPPYYALDAGKEDASGKFICMLDGKRFWKGRTGDGQWRNLDVDLMSLLREALAITQQHGFLKNSRMEDLALTSFNMGWEIPGPYDAAFEFYGLSMRGESK